MMAATTAPAWRAACAALTASAHRCAAPGAAGHAGLRAVSPVGTASRRASGRPRRAHGMRSARGSRWRTGAVPQGLAHPCAPRAAGRGGWGTCGCRASASDAPAHQRALSVRTPPVPGPNTAHGAHGAPAPGAVAPAWPLGRAPALAHFRVPLVPSAMPAPEMEPELTGRCRPATCAPAQLSAPGVPGAPGAAAPAAPHCSTGTGTGMAPASAWGWTWSCTPATPRDALNPAVSPPLSSSPAALPAPGSAPRCSTRSCAQPSPTACLAASALRGSWSSAVPVCPPSSVTACTPMSQATW